MMEAKLSKPRTLIVPSAFKVKLVVCCREVAQGRKPHISNLLHNLALQPEAVDTGHSAALPCRFITYTLCAVLVRVARVDGVGNLVPTQCHGAQSVGKSATSSGVSGSKFEH